MIRRTRVKKQCKMLLDQIVQELKDPSKKIIVVAGSGLSRATPAEIPTWIPMFEELCQYCEQLGYQESAHLQRKIAKTALYDPAYLTVCFEKLREVMTSTVYESAIKRILSPKKQGTPAAIKRLVSIPFTGIITTNLDELIKDAAEEANKKGHRPNILELYTSTDGIVQGDLARQGSWLWQIHGNINRPETWVFTASEYAKSIYKNVTYRTALATVVQSSRLVLIGFSGSDPDVNRILELLSSTFGGRKDVHAMLVRQREDFNEKYLAELNINLIEYGGPEDHSALLKLLDKFPHFSRRKHRKKHPIVAGDFDDTRLRKWIEDETGYIDIRGIGVGSTPGFAAIRFPILKLYTELYIQRGLSHYDLDQEDIRGKQRISLIDVLKSARCLAVLGDPGAGKTTFLRYVARSQLEKADNPLPFYISLLDVYQFAISKQESAKVHQPALTERLQLSPEILIEFLMDISNRERLGLTKDGLQKRIQDGCVWLLDSLDELPSSQVREIIVEAVTAASRRWKNCQFVLASRPFALTGKAIPVGFEVVRIDHMHDEEVLLFLRFWTSLLFVNSTNVKQCEYCDELYSTIKNSPQLRSLAMNPVMLTSMAVVHFNQKRLPENRADLLRAVIYWLIYAREQVRQRPRNDSKLIEKIHRQIALAMFEDPGGRKIRVGRLWAARKIAQKFDGDEQVAVEYLSRLENEIGLLVRRGEGDIAFWLPWFQEYFAAEEIAGQLDDENAGWWAKIRDHLDDPQWREIFSFVPACLYLLGSERVDLFFDRLGNSSFNADLATKVKRVGLGGRILRDLLVIGYKPANVHSWRRILNNILPIFSEEVEGIKLEDRYEAAVAYGLGGDDRIRDFEATWVSIRGGIFYMGAQANDSSARNYDPYAESWESPVVEVQVASFEIRKYPITVQEFEEFVADDGYSQQKLWSVEGWHWHYENNIKAPGDWEEQLLSPNCPVTAISRFEAEAYCRWLTLKASRQDMVYRLPIEAEWEYAARYKVPDGQRFSWGNELNLGDGAEANWAGCNLRKKTPVGMFPKSNTADGIADMIGNVEEWCSDSWSPDHTGYSRDGSVRINECEPRAVVRGGSAIRFSRLCRPTYRSRIFKNRRYNPVGFRPVRVSK